MSQAIPASQDRYADILTSVMWAVNTGGMVVRFESEGDIRQAIEDERRAAQRALNWVWNKQMSKQGNDVRYVHGETKLNMLLPLCKSWGGKKLARAEFIESVLENVPNYQHKVGVAYDMVRSRDLSIKHMAEYLTVYQRQAAEQGVVLESNSDLEFKSLMVYADQARG